MSEEIKMELAKKNYESLCRALDEKEWHYKKYEEDLVISSGIKGKDLPIEFIVSVSPERELVSFLSHLPFSIENSKRIDLALAVCAANYALPDGGFDYNVTNGEISFRLSASYRNSVLNSEIYDYMVMFSCLLIDKYNDKFFMLSKGALDIEAFLSEEYGNGE